MSRLALAFLLSACGEASDLQVPSLTCMHVETEVIAAEPICRRFGSATGARFRTESADACEGSPCLWLGAGETAAIVQEFSDVAVTWYSAEVACDAEPPRECAH